MNAEYRMMPPARSSQYESALRRGNAMSRAPSCSGTMKFGARDMAFPRLNALSYWLLLAGGIILYSAFIVGPPMTGWTMYVPLSTREFMPGNGMDLVILGLTVLGFSSIFGALN